MIKTAFIVLLVALSPLASANGKAPVQSEANRDGYQPAKGWHFYEVPPDIMEKIEKKIEEEVEKRLAEKEASSAPAAGSSEWIKQNLPVARQNAADNPTTENIRALLLMERMLRDKATRLARRVAMVSQSDPLLDGSYKPTSSLVVARDRRTSITQNREDVFKALIKRDSISLWLFVDEKCSFCDEWIFVLSKLTKDFGVKVLFIVRDPKTFPPITDDYVRSKWSIVADKDGTRSAKLDVRNPPSLIAHNAIKKEYAHVSQGFVVGDKLIERLLSAADFAGWITGAEAEKTNFDIDRNNLSGVDFSGFTGDPTDINAVTDYMYNKLLEGQ